MSLKINTPNPDYDRLFSENFDGQLSVDVHETEKFLIITSLIAGVKQKDIDIAIHNNLLTIKGRREQPTLEDDAHILAQECFWGNFSRSIVLPKDVIAEEIVATFQNAILTIRLPKALKTKKINVVSLD